MRLSASSMITVPAPPFPLKNPAPREIRQMGTFPSMDRLEEEKKLLEGREEARETREPKQKDAKAVVKAPAGKRANGAKPDSVDKLKADLETEINRILAGNESGGSLAKTSGK